MENEETNIELELETEEESPTEEKAKVAETPEAKRSRLQRQLAQLDKKLGIKEEKNIEKEETKGELDKMDRAILRMEKITDPDEVALVKDFMRDTGKSIDDVLENRVFKAELKAMREDKKADDAIPSNSKRSMNSNRNSVEYWLAKGEMPPAGETKLRQDYVNARIAKTKERHMFSDNPIA